MSSESHNIPEKIDDYRVISRLGEGGWGSIYRVISESTGHEYALKLFKDTAHSSIKPVKRFQREFRALSKLRHPNIVQVYTLFEQEDSCFFTMELVDGKPLDDYINGDKLPTFPADFLEESRMTRIYTSFCQILKTLDYLHSKYIVHRDLKPSNILVTSDGDIKIADFGMVKDIDITSKSSTKGSILGTTIYMSPEQIRGTEIDGRADLYSLGIILYQMITGRQPFESENIYTLIFKHLGEPPVPPSRYNPLIDAALEKIILRSLRKSPSFRFISALQFLDELDKYFSMSRLCTPVEVSEAGDIEPEKPVLTFYVPQFLGRDEEIETLINSVKEVMIGIRRIIIIEGDTGIGKTRLGQELESLVKLQNIIFRWGTCINEHKEPYNLFRNIFESFLAETEKWTSDDYIKLLGNNSYLLQNYVPGISWNETYNNMTGSFNPDISKTDFKTVLFDIFIKLIQFCTNNRPAIFYLDDLQWADDLSIEFLDHLLQKILYWESTPHYSNNQVEILLVYSFRQGELRENPLLRKLVDFTKEQPKTLIHRLQPFNERESRAFVTSFLGKENIGKDLFSMVYEEGDGVPFYMKEIIRSLVESEKLYTGRENQLVLTDEFQITPLSNIDVYPTIPIPEPVQERIIKRIDKLPVDHYKVLATCSIIGKEFSFEMLRETLDMDEEKLLDILDHLLNVQILKEAFSEKQEKFQFYHDKVREVVIANLDLNLRKNLHLRIAKMYENCSSIELEGLYSLLAYHYDHGDDGIKTLEYSEKTAMIFEQGKMYNNAIFYYNRCLEILFKSGIEENDDYGVKTREILKHEGYIFLDMGNTGKSIASFTRMFNIAEKARDLKDQGEALLNLGRIYLLEGNLLKGKKLTLRAKHLFDFVKDDYGAARCMSNLGKIYLESGQPEKARQMARNLTEVSRKKDIETGILTGNNNLGLICISMGKSYKALKHFNDSLEIYQKNKDTQGIGITLKRIATVYRNLGKPEKALQMCREAIDLLNNTGDLNSIAETRIKIGECLFDLNHPKQAYKYFRSILKLEDQLGPSPNVMTSLIHLGTIKALKFKRIESGLKQIDRAIHMGKKIMNNEVSAFALQESGGIYFVKQEYEIAEKYCMDSLELLFPFGLNQNLFKTYGLLLKLSKINNKPDMFKYYHSKIEKQLTGMLRDIDTEFQKDFLNLPVLKEIRDIQV